MALKIEQILKDLKAAGFVTSRVETDLGFSNGLLGKAAKGKTELSKEKYIKLIEYYGLHVAGISILQYPKETDPVKDYKEPVLQVSQEFKDEFDRAVLRTIPWVTKVEDYCGVIGMTPEELIEDHKRMAVIKSIGVKSESKTEYTTVFNEGYDPFKNPRFTSKMGPKKEE